MFNKIVKSEAERVSAADLQKALKQLKGWTHDNSRLVREVAFKDYQLTWAFLTQVAMRSHLWGHHPLITTSYTSVRLELQTHDLEMSPGHVNDRMRVVCSGMYSKEARGGKVDPFIGFDLEKLYPTQHDYEPGVIAVIYDFRDYQHIGIELPNGEVQYVCDEYSIGKGLCKESQLNHFIIQDVIYDPFSDSTKGLSNEVLTFSHNYLGKHQSVYPVMKTGYYCVRTATISSSIRFDVAINFRNAFGKIDAAEIDNIRLYGWLSLGYLSTSITILITAVPTVLLMFVFFFLILRAITKTTSYLKGQRQTYKLSVYNRLLIVIYATLVCIFIGLILCAFAYLGMNAIEIIEKHWMIRFYLTDFWPSLVYFFAFISFAYIWRPTGTTFMLTTSQQQPEELENVMGLEMDDLDEFSDEFDMDDYAESETSEHRVHGINEAERQNIDDIFANNEPNMDDVFSDQNELQDTDVISNFSGHNSDEDLVPNASNTKQSINDIANPKTRK
ncbi:hypothetical protein LTX96_0000708 [Nakaseomyces glabratus]|nr:hypothetical protein LTX96_0000708 [Nakaseomyces glabratus]